MKLIEPLNDIQKSLILLGKCPFCERAVKNWVVPTGFIAPEAWADLRDRGIDPGTGHDEKCAHKDMRL